MPSAPVLGLAYNPPDDPEPPNAKVTTNRASSCALSTLDLSVTAPLADSDVRGIKTITWTTSGSSALLSTVTLGFWYRIGSGTWVKIVEDVANDGAWESPSQWDTTGLPNSDDYFLYTYVYESAPLLNCYRYSITNPSFRIDNLLPAVAISVPTTGTVWGTGTHAITWATTEVHKSVAKIEYSADGGTSWTTITASTADTGATGTYNWDTSALSDGANYKIRVNHTDAAGNVGSTTTSAFTIDRTLPVVASVSAPALNAQWKGTQSIVWSTTDVNPSTVKLEYYTGSGAWTTIAAAATDTGSYSWSTASLSDGSAYQVRVTPTDLAGNVGVAVASSAFTIDNTLPAVTVTAPASAAAVKGTQAVTWTATETNRNTAKLEYSANGGSSWTTIAASASDTGTYNWDTTALTDGANYQLRITLTDLAGNLGAASVSGTFRIDNTAPSALLSAPTASSFWTGTKTIAWTTTDAVASVAKVEYSANGGTSWTTLAAAATDSGSYSWDTSALADGATYKIRITPTDAAGNLGAAVTSAAFVLDHTVPAVSVTAPTSGFKSGTQTVSWTTTDANVDTVAVQYSTNSGTTWTTLVSSTADVGSYSFDTTAVADGAYVVRVTATDKALNAGSGSSVSFNIDNLAPVVTVSTPTSSSVWGVSPTITWTTVEGNKGTVLLEYSANGGTTWTTIASAAPDTGSYVWTTTGLTDGANYKVRITATDLAAKVGTAVASSAFALDLTAPSAVITAPTAGTLRGSVTVTWTTTDANKNVAKVEYSADGGTTWTTAAAAASDTGSYAWDTSGLVNGANYKVRVTPTDLASNAGAAAASAVFTLDNTGVPASLASSTHTSSVWSTSRTLSVSWVAPTTTTDCYSWGLDALPDDICDGTGLSASVSGLADGTHVFYVKAKGTNGYWGASAGFSGVDVDGTAPGAPTISSTTHAAGACTALSDGVFAWTSLDTVSGILRFEYALDGATATSTSSTGATLTGLADGSRSLRVTAYDGAGNSAAATYAFTVASASPTVAMTGPALTKGSTFTVTYSATAACAATSTPSVEYRLNGGDWKSVPLAAGATSFVFEAAASDGTYEFRGRADAAGRTGTFPATPQVSVVVDRTPPSAPSARAGTAVGIGVFDLSWGAATDDRSGVAGYNVYRVDATTGLTLLTSAPITATTFRDSPGTPTAPYYVVRALDRAGNEGPPTIVTAVSHLWAQAFAAAEAGPAILVTWASLATPGSFSYIEIRVWEDDGPSRVLIRSPLAQGTVSFFGIEGHTYRFTAVLVDSEGRSEPKAVGGSASDAATRVVSDTSAAGPAAVAAVNDLAGGGIDKGFQAVDRNHDGLPEIFEDPNGRLVADHILPLDRGDLAFLVRDGRATSAGGQPLALWSPGSGQVRPVALAHPIGDATTQSLAGGRLALSVSVDKGGWIYIPIADPAPGRAIDQVVAGDGRVIPVGFYWRIPGFVIVVDDPSTTYHVIYGPLAAAGVNALALMFALVGLTVAGGVGWLEGPSTERLRQARRPARGWAWGLRYCPQCREPLTRLERLWRPAHAHEGFSARLRIHRWNWSLAGLGAKLRYLHDAAAVPWPPTVPVSRPIPVAPPYVRVSQRPQAAARPRSR